ncbi:MAG TPA: alpha/beta hydrolase [Micromonosporaceae bacterium]|nr:alpha/beta hydrolase [Micromonosporaceae bacterium]
MTGSGVSPLFVDQVTGRGIDADIDPAVLATLMEAAASPAAADLGEARNRYRRTSRRRSLAPAPIADVGEHDIPRSDGSALRVRVYRPTAARSGVLIYFHGGGLKMGDLDSHDSLLRLVSFEAEVAIVAVGYRLVPEYAFPAQTEDAWTALGWVAREAGRLGLDRSRIAVGGDSAGGLLAAATAQRARDAGAPGLVQQVLLYPLTDLTLSSESNRRYAAGPVLTRAWHQEGLARYVPSDRTLTDPEISPRYGDPRALPPTLIVTAEHDPLRDDGESYGTGLRRAGVSTVVVRYQAMVHDFALMTATVPAARHVVGTVAAAIRERLAPGPGTPSRPK